MTPSILIVDDDTQLRESVSQTLSSKYQILQAFDGIHALEVFSEIRCDVVVLDVNMPRLNGIETLKKIKSLEPKTIVIIVTAFTTIEDAVICIKEGAYNYLSKPVQNHSLFEMLGHALEAKKMVENVAFSAPRAEINSVQIVGTSNEMTKVFELTYRVSKVETPILIRGQSGTGKELVAKTIHYNSSHKEHRFVAINCSSIPETLFESEIFGYEKGAFTGANQRQIGKFQYAEMGTLFLDEIGDLPLSMQAKLLRVLQDKKFSPLGSHREIDLTARVIAATHRNLEEMIKQNTFREDLYYRLNVIPIFLPPLKERKTDIEKLLFHFIHKFNLLHKKQIGGITEEAYFKMMQHSWPGNIRELENAIEHAFILEATDKIHVDSLPTYLTSSNFHENSSINTLDFSSFKEASEKEFIIQALKKFNGKINQTSEEANIPKKTLLRKLKKYQIDPKIFR